MPQELVDKIKRAKNFSEGYSLTEVLAAAELDMQWHSLSADAPLQNPDEFEKQALTGKHLDGGAAALSFIVFQPHMGERLLSRLLRLLVDRDARR